MLVYSVTSRTSFDILLEIRRKIEDVKKVAHVPVIVVGNKADMAHVRQVTQDQGKENRCSALNCMSEQEIPVDEVEKGIRNVEKMSNM